MQSNIMQKKNFVKKFFIFSKIKSPEKSGRTREIKIRSYTDNFSRRQLGLFVSNFFNSTNPHIQHRFSFSRKPFLMQFCEFSDNNPLLQRASVVIREIIVYLPSSNMLN